MTNTQIGILGGGQLARMLALSAHPLGLNVSVLTPLASDPAAQVAGNTRLGSLSDQADLRKFMADLTALMAVGGLYFSFVFYRMTKHPLVPVKDPRLGRSLHFVNA